MRRLNRTLTLAALLWLCLAFLGAALGEAADEAVQAESPAAPIVYAALPVNQGTVEIHSTELNEEPWLFLPAHADRAQLSLRVEGVGEVQCSELLETDEEGVFLTSVLGEEGDALFELHVMQSENLRALYLFSDDPISHGREWLEDCPRHENETTGAMALIAADGDVDHVNEISKLRGRGNGTWKHDKKAYQIKLESKDDLLDTGIKAERSRTWVLLAGATDTTFLHDRITFDLALEMGLSESSLSEYVDLYYDGEYRGTYLLCEKVEVGEGRVNIVDYDDLLEAWNERMGVANLELLEVGTSTNRYEYWYSFIKDVYAMDDPSVGGYLVEMEYEYLTLTDRCWFRLGDGSVLALKNPENASKEMVAYVSELLEEGRRVLLGRGTNPETGLTLEERFDIDAFARIALINELAYNIDGFTYSSSFFVLPEGETCFRPGPVWDFDLAYRYLLNGKNQNGEGFKDSEGWLYDFYSCLEFREQMQKIYSETLYSLINDILLGSQQGEYLRPLGDYAQEIAASQRMNGRLFATAKDSRLQYGEDAESDLALLRQFLSERNEWLYETVMSWEMETADRADLMFDAIYTCAENNQRLRPMPWSNIQVRSYASSLIREATETDFAVYLDEVILEPMEGFAFSENTVVTVNNEPLSCEHLADGTICVRFTFEDPSYRPVDYYGEDLGLIYNADYYMQQHPEVVEECGGDPEAILEYFYYDGISEGQSGTAFFNLEELLLYLPELEKIYMKEWDLLYTDFIYETHEEWMTRLNKRFTPSVTDAAAS